MYALRERRVHVTQEDFEMAVAKVSAVGRQRRGHKVSWVTFAGSWVTFAGSWELALGTDATMKVLSPSS